MHSCMQAGMLANACAHALVFVCACMSVCLCEPGLRSLGVRMRVSLWARTRVSSFSPWQPRGRGTWRGRREGSRQPGPASSPRLLRLMPQAPGPGQGRQAGCPGRLPAPLTLSLLLPNLSPSRASGRRWRGARSQTRGLGSAHSGSSSPGRIPTRGCPRGLAQAATAPVPPPPPPPRPLRPAEARPSLPSSRCRGSGGGSSAAGSARTKAGLWPPVGTGHGTRHGERFSRPQPSLSQARPPGVGRGLGGQAGGVGGRSPPAWPLLSPRCLGDVCFAPRCRDCALGRSSSLGTRPLRPGPGPPRWGWSLSPGFPAPAPVSPPPSGSAYPKEAMPWSVCVPLPPSLRNPHSAPSWQRCHPASHSRPRWAPGVDLDALPSTLHTPHLREPRPPGPPCAAPSSPRPEDSRATTCFPSSWAPAPHPPLKAPRTLPAPLHLPDRAPCTAGGDLWS